MRHLAPWSALIILCGLSYWCPNRVATDETAAARQAEIAAAVEAVPYFLGEWIGRDEEVPQEAQRLLRPNAILSRVYQKTGGLRLHLVLVHCGDARDMIGHYPPVCYPSAGWLACPIGGGPGAENLVVATDTHTLPVRLYEFRRLREHGHEERIVIFSGFVLPGGTVTREIDDINRQSQRRAVSAQGVAQLQVIAPAELERVAMLDAVGELLGELTELLDALEVGTRAGEP